MSYDRARGYQPMHLEGRHVVITGASQGIGEQLARRCADRGAKVLIAARSVDRLEALADEIGATVVGVDLLDTEQSDTFVSRCLEQLGHIDVFVNNAGLDTDRAFIDLDHRTIRDLCRLNLEATMVLTRDVARHMVRRGSGRIVQMSSVAGVVPFPGLAAYAGTKAAITHFSETLRLELKGTGVTMTIAAPGPTATAMWKRIDESAAGFADPALKRFRRVAYLPVLDPAKVAEATVRGVERDRAQVRLPARYGIYHLLNNAPRRLLTAALTGVRLVSPIPDPDRYDSSPSGGGAERLWPCDDEPSVKWPLYTRGNVGEVFPEVVLPLTWSTFGIDAEMGWRAAYERMGLLMPGDLSPDEPMTILGVFGGYCYINASYVRMLGVRAPGASVEAIDQQFFGESDAPAYTKRPGDTSGRSTARLARTIWRTLRTSDLPRVADDVELASEWIAGRPDQTATDNELFDRIVAFKPVFRHLFSTHIENTFSVALVSSLLADLCAKSGHPELLVSLLGGIGDIESAEPSAEMWRLSRLDPGSPAYADGLQDFLDRYGSRGPNEWEIAADPWELRPERAIVAIDAMRSADEDHEPGSQRTRLAQRRVDATATVRGALNPVDRWLFDKALAATALYSQARERSKTTVIRALHSIRLTHRDLAQRIRDRDGGEDLTAVDICLLNGDEFAELVNATDVPGHLRDTIQSRRLRHHELSNRIPPFVFEGRIPPCEQWSASGTGAPGATVGMTLQGIAGCPGLARGRARVITDPGEPGDLGPGDVLIAPITDPSWTPLFLAAEAVVVDMGATMSHAVIVSRELGIPCVVSAVGATSTIPDGAVVEVDGNHGTVTVIELPS